MLPYLFWVPVSLHLGNALLRGSAAGVRTSLSQGPSQLQGPEAAASLTNNGDCSLILLGVSRNIADNYEIRAKVRRGERVYFMLLASPPVWAESQRSFHHGVSQLHTFLLPLSSTFLAISYGIFFHKKCH